MPAPSFTVPISGLATTLSPSEIDRVLSSMWKPVSEKEGGAVTRVVLGNLLWVGAREELESMQAVVAGVVPKYPCRLFLLVHDEANQSTTVQASVNAQCFRPDPRNPAVCCEVIRFDFGPQGARHVRGSVAPLLLPDLQTVLWVGSSSTVQPLVEDLRGEVDRTIHLISRAPKPADRLMSCLTGPGTAFDLSWFRMKPIRDQVTAFFDDPDSGFDLSTIRSVSIRAGAYQPSSSLPEVMACIFLGWLGSRLGWEPGRGAASGYLFRAAGGEIRVSLRGCVAGPDGTRSPISTIEMLDDKDEHFRLSFAPHGDTMEISTDTAGECSAERRLCLRELGEAAAMGLALNSMETGNSFRRAARLAAPVLEYYCS